MADKRPLSKTYNDNVFINCPFDPKYLLVFQSIVFTIIRCGFIPRCALAYDDATENRIDKLYRLIEACRYGIHDISNTRLDPVNHLPRFNMAFELGLYLAAKRFGNKKNQKKIALILEKEKFKYQTYISDLNGVDPKAHNDNPETAIQIVRTWLSDASRRKLPGHITIQNDFNNFYNNILPGALKKWGLELVNLSFNDYCLIAEEWLIEIPAQQ